MCITIFTTFEYKSIDFSFISQKYARKGFEIEVYLLAIEEEYSSNKSEKTFFTNFRGTPKSCEKQILTNF